MHIQTWKRLTEGWDKDDQARERNEEAASVFFETLARNDWVGASKLISRGCSANMTLGMRTALMCAAENGSVECLSLLVRTGANIGAQDEIGRDSIFCAIEARSNESIDFLLAQGPRLKRMFEDNKTPLISATQLSYVHGVRALVGFDKNTINQFDRLGRTALWHVLSKPELSDEDNEIARILLDAGADPKMADLDGISPEDAASAEQAKALLEKAELERDLAQKLDQTPEPTIATPTIKTPRPRI